MVPCSFVHEVTHETHVLADGLSDVIQLPNAINMNTIRELTQTPYNTYTTATLASLEQSTYMYNGLGLADEVTHCALYEIGQSLAWILHLSCAMTNTNTDAHTILKLTLTPTLYLPVGEIHMILLGLVDAVTHCAHVVLKLKPCLARSSTSLVRWRTLTLTLTPVYK